MRTKLSFLCLALLLGFNAHGFQNNSYLIGWTPTFTNMVDRVSTTDSRKTSFLGTSHLYVLSLAATFQFGYGNSFWQPFFNYSLFPRKNSSGDIEERLILLGFKYGQNFSESSYGGGWDWSVGTGIWRSTLKGLGGEYTDPNGASFYLPSSSTTSQMIFTSAGIGYESDNLRYGTDLFLLNLLHSKKRSYNMMLTIAWKGNWL